MMKKLTVWLIVLMMAMAGLCLAALAEDVLLSTENEVSAPEAPIVPAPAAPSEPAGTEDPAPSSPSQDVGSAPSDEQEDSPKQDSEEAPKSDSDDMPVAGSDADPSDSLDQQGEGAGEPDEDFDWGWEDGILVDLDEILAMEVVVRYLYSDGNRDHEYAEFFRTGKLLFQTTFVPARAGYVFDFWYEDECEVKPFEFGNKIERDITLRAHFIREDLAGLAEPVELEGQEEEEELEEQEEQESSEIAALEEIKVTITSDVAPGLKLGDAVTLFASIEGAEGFDYTTEWMYNDGSGWQAAPDGEGMTYRFELNENNNGWVWKMAVTVLVADGEAA